MTIDRTGQKMEFRLIVDCRVEDAEKILDYAKENFDSNFVIITNNLMLKIELNKNGNFAETIDDTIPVGTIQETQAFERAHAGAESIAKHFSNTTYKGVEISSTFMNKIRDELHHLEKINVILRSKTEVNVIVCLTDYNYYHFAYSDLAEILGYRILLPNMVKHDSILSVDPSSIVSHNLVFKSLYSDKLGNYKKPRFSFLKSFINRITTTDKLITDKLITNMEKNSCIFLLQTNAADLYLKPVYPVIEEFQRRQYPFLILTADWRTAENIKKRNMQFVDFSSHIDEINLEDSNIIKESILVFRNIASLNNIIGVLSRYLLNDAFHSELTRNCKVIEFFKKVISEVNPVSIFVMPDGTDFSTIMCAVARKGGIQTSTTVAAVVAPSIRSITPHSADLIFSYGEQCNEAFLKMNYDKNRLVLTGNPFFDKIMKITKKDAKNNLSKFIAINFESPIILIATGGVDRNESFWMYETIKYANKKNYQVIVKVHPAVELSDYVKIHNNPDKLSFQIIQNVDILELLAVADIVITDNSTVGLLAILFEKPLMVANLTGKAFLNNRYDEMGVALLATSIKEIESKLNTILTDKDVQEELKIMRKKQGYHYYYKNDGMAASRIYDLLTKQHLKL